MRKSYKVPARVSIGVGTVSLVVGGTNIYAGLRKLKGKLGFNDRFAIVILGASLMWLGAAAIDGGMAILKEEGILK